MERAVLLSRREEIVPDVLSLSMQKEKKKRVVFIGGLKAQLEEIEVDIIIEALRSSRGNMAMAARKLEISERIMGLRVKKYGIDIYTFRS